MIPGAPENKALPISPLRIEHKLGFKPVLHCACGASIDTGKARRKDVEAFVAAHEECVPANRFTRAGKEFFTYSEIDYFSAQ